MKTIKTVHPFQKGDEVIIDGKLHAIITGFLKGGQVAVKRTVDRKSTLVFRNQLVKLNK